MSNDALAVFDDINWNDAPDAPPAVPTGEYHLKITKCDAVLSKQKGTPGFSVEAVIQSGEQAGRTIYSRIWMTDKTKWAIKQFFGKKGLDLIGADGKANFAAAVGWEGIAKVTTKISEESDFPEYRIKPLSVLA